MLGLALLPRSGWAATIGAMPTILIVDDHAAFRLEARQLLEAEGFTVIGEAADGEAGLLLATTECHEEGPPW
jgi:PleD family two-component response regulator